MLFRSGFTRFVALAVGGLLLNGCQNRASTSAARADIPKPMTVSHTLDRADSRDELNVIEAHAHYATALVQEMNGETEESLTSFHEAAIRDLDNEPLILEVSRRLLQARQTEKTEKALDLLLRATSRPNASGLLFARLGFIHFQLGKPELAISANRTAIKRDPRSLVGYQNLFLIHLQTGKAQEVLKLLDDAARVSGTNPEFLIGLGELYGNFGLQSPAQREAAFAKGTAVLQRAWQEKPSEPQLQMRLADAFSVFGKSEEAAEVYRDLLNDLGDMPFLQDGIRAKLTEIYLRGRDTKHAAEQLEGLIQQNPTDAQAHYFLASIRYGETNYAGAADAFSKVILLNPGFEQAYYDLAASQLNDDKAADALITLEKARQQFPQKFECEYLMGLAYTQQNDYTNALKHFTASEIIAEATAQIRPANQLRDSFYFQLGATCERIGDHARAEKYFEKCLELSPNHHEAQNYLGYMLADRGEKLDRAKALIERALTAEPENAAYLDSMGWVLFKLDQPKEALEYLIQAVEKSEEEDATLYDHLGDVYARLNEPEKAREAWTKAHALVPSADIQRKIESSAK
jgi:tetratricopeptide (TPR) repeat protein